MVDSSSTALLEELNKKRKTARLLPVVALAAVVMMIALLNTEAPSWLDAMLFLSLAGLTFLAHRRDQDRKTTIIHYEMEPGIGLSYQKMGEAFAQLRDCRRVWHIVAAGKINDRKYHAGASALVERKSIVFRQGAAPFIQTNIDVPQVLLGSLLLAFFPDRLLIFGPDSVGAVSYRDLKIEIRPSRFIEEGLVPSDATVVDSTWHYVNRAGGPDRRFKNNRKLPVVLYEEVRLTSASGLNEVLQLSRSRAGEAFAMAIHEMSRVVPNTAFERLGKVVP